MLPVCQWYSFEGAKTHLNVYLASSIINLSVVGLLKKKLLDLKMSLKLAGREEQGRDSGLPIFLSTVYMSRYNLSVNARKMEGRKDREVRRGRTNSPSVLLEKYRNALKSLVCYNCMAVIIYHLMYVSVLFALDYFIKGRNFICCQWVAFITLYV